jgi:hypothetical protein
LGQRVWIHGKKPVLAMDGGVGDEVDAIGRRRRRIYYTDAVPQLEQSVYYEAWVPIFT